MASLWLSLLMVLSSLVAAGSYKLPSLWLLIQDGSPGEDADRHPANADYLASAQRQWAWKASGDEGHRDPLSARQKREDSLGSNNSSAATKEPPKKSLPVAKAMAGTSAAPRKILKGQSTEPSPPVSTAKKAAQEVAALTTTVGTPLLGASPKLGSISTEAKHPKDGPHFVTKVGAVPSRGASKTAHTGKEAATVAFPEMGKVLTTTEYWSWLHDATSQTLVASTDSSTPILKHGLTTAGPVLKPKRKPVSLLTATASPTSDWRSLDDITTASSQTLVGISDVSTATVRHGLTPAGTNFKAKGGVSLKTAKASPTTLWPWLDDISTASSQTLVDSSDASTSTKRQGLRGKGKGSVSSITTVASPTTAAPAKPAGGTATMVGKCLLALFLLALVAAIFIVITAVLAAMLWRQKQAYKMHQYNHTEMVCISSLLATEEAEEARGRHPRVKRVKMLGENGSETEMDNLTLNSFLPDH